MKPYYESGGITIYHGDCREAIGIELEEKWCEVAVKRMFQEVLL